MSQGPQIVTYGNVASTFILTATLSPTIVNANTTSQQTFNVTGLQTTDQISAVIKPTYQTGLLVVGGGCLTNGVLTIQFANVTGSGITPTASEVYSIEVNRPAGFTMPGIQ
jgi:hypothetical protein